MNFSALFIRRPVLATVVSLLILLLGLQGAVSLAVRQYPKVEDSVITITTAYPGASSDLIQGFITTPIAKAVSSVDGADYITSSSAQSSSTVVVHMRLGADPDKALTDAMSKVQSVKRTLPQDAEDPIVVKGSGWTRPQMFLAFSSQTMTAQQISEYLARVIQPRLATVDGVAEAKIIGASEFAMRVWLDPIRLAAHNVTASEVSAAIKAANFLAAPGRLKNEFYTYAVETNTTLRTPEAFGALPVKGAGGDVVRLRDVATVELGAQNYDQAILSNRGGAAVFLGIIPTPGANPLSVGDDVTKLFPSIQADLPPGLKGEINYDFSKQIRGSIKEVFKTIGEAVLIVILVIFLFLGSMRSVLVPTVTIPLSLVGVCFVLFALGYSINLLTLLAMVLAIGLVVDDAIVVVENVHRHIELGQKPMDAAVSSMKEIVGPLVAMTVTLAAVYAPIGFVQGLTGALFREFAFALAGAVIISGIIALTLSPMMSARLLKPAGHQEVATGKFWDFTRWIDRAFTGLAERYAELLRLTLASRGVVLLMCGAVLATLVVMFMHTTNELAPQEDEGFFNVFARAPSYATVDYTTRAVRQLEKQFGDVPEATTHFFMAGAFGPSNQAVGFYVLKPWGERSRTARQVVQSLQPKASAFPSAQVNLFAPNSLPGVGGDAPIQFVIRSIDQPERVYEVAEEVRAKAMQSGKFFFMQSSLSYDQPRTTLSIDRERAASLGVPISDIGATLNVLLSEGWVSRFDQGNRSYQVIPQADPADRFDPEKLGRYYVRSKDGAMVPLAALTKVETAGSPQSIEQFNQLNSATILAMPAMSSSVADGLQTLRDIAREVMPDGFFIDYMGEGRLAGQESHSLMTTFIFAVIMIYLVLAAQFESFRDPLIIMTAVPLSIFGAMIPLNLGPLFQLQGASLNIYSELGLITLVGLIAKHGILLVKFANDRRAAGVGMHEAIIEAAHVRLRPILMTTASMVMGVMPLLIASGAGAGARKSIGLVIASGMSVGTLFTLFVVPVFYTFIARRDASAAQARARRPETETARRPAARAAE